MNRLLRPFARSMTRTAAALAAVVSLPGCAAQPSPQVATAAEAQAPAEPRPALWKVADADTTIYLFGTIHALPAGLTWFDGRVADAFARSQELVTEIAGGQDEDLQAIVLDKAMLPAGKSLRSLLTAEDGRDYEAALQTQGLPAQAFDPFEPWYAAVGLSTLPMLKSGYDRNNGVEARLEAEAKARALPHTGLETAAYQLGLFDALPLDVQTRYLNEVVDNLPTLQADLGKMIVAWKTGDAEELARLMNAAEDDPALVDALLTNRNRAWAGWIDHRLTQPGTVFVAVGAGHLAGKGSVQEFLASQGHPVTRVQ